MPGLRDKIPEMLHCMFWEIHKIYNSKCFYYDGNNRWGLLLISSSGFLLNNKIRQIICYNTWSWLLNNVIRQVIYRFGMHIFGVFDDHTDLKLQWEYLLAICSDCNIFRDKFRDSVVVYGCVCSRIWHYFDVLLFGNGYLEGNELCLPLKT